MPGNPQPPQPRRLRRRSALCPAPGRSAPVRAVPLPRSRPRPSAPPRPRRRPLPRVAMGPRPHPHPVRQPPSRVQQPPSRVRLDPSPVPPARARVLPPNHPRLCQALAGPCHPRPRSHRARGRLLPSPVRQLPSRGLQAPDRAQQAPGRLHRNRARPQVGADRQLRAPVGPGLLVGRARVRPLPSRDRAAVVRARATIPSPPPRAWAPSSGAHAPMPVRQLRAPVAHRVPAAHPVRPARARARPCPQACRAPTRR